MEIIWLLGFIALIAVIFGVSMHQAFWGIVAFIVGALFVSFLVLLAKAGMVRIGKKIAYLETPAGKAAQRQNAKDLFWTIIILSFLSPLPLVAVLVATMKDQPEWVPFIIGMLPFIFALSAVIFVWLKPSKKRVPKKTR